MPDVISLQPADVRMFVACDVHKLSIVAATLPPAGGRAEIHRLFQRHRRLTGQGKRSTVVTVAIARELSAFLWAEMTDQLPREEQLAA